MFNSLSDKILYTMQLIWTMYLLKRRLIIHSPFIKMLAGCGFESNCLRTAVAKYVDICKITPKTLVIHH